jgi:CheY-like chemotaxis protein
MARKILIVDDEPDIIAVMKYTLEREGFEVITAYNGEEGVRKAKENLPDLIILDVLMPKMSGDIAGARLREDPLTGSIPVIYLTNVPIDFLASSGTMSDMVASVNKKEDIFLPKYSCEEDFLAAVYKKLDTDRA